MYENLSDGDFLLQTDVPEILAVLNNGGPYTKAGLRTEIDTGTRPSQFFEEVDQLVKRGFASLKGEELSLTAKGIAAL